MRRVGAVHRLGWRRRRCKPLGGWPGRWLAVLCLLGLWLGNGPARATDHLVQLTQAEASFQLPGRYVDQSVTLPFAWDAAFPGQAGSAMFRLRFELAEIPAMPMALHTRRLGNSYEMWFNGSLIDHAGEVELPNQGSVSHFPRYVGLPSKLLGHENELLVVLRADANRSAGLTDITIGPADVVRRIYEKDHRWRVTGAQLVLSVSLLSALLCLSLWATQYRFEVRAHHQVRRRRDPVYLLVAVADLCWVLRVGDVLIEQPPLAWPWWGLVPTAALGGWAIAMGAFCMTVGGATRWKRFRPTWTGLGAAMLANLVLVLAAQWLGWPGLQVAWFGLLGVSLLGLGALFFVHAFSARGGWPKRLVAISLIVNSLAGLRDLVVFYIEPAYGEYTWLRYSSLLFGISLAWFVLDRFRRVNQRNWDLMHGLSSQVAQREAELAQSYRQLESLARQQERVAERSRILRDMHDGVGSHLSTALRQLQSGRSSSQAIEHTLRDALDQLKLSIDAIHLPPGDVGALLANLRYRLQGRFADTDLQLVWDVWPLPDQPDWAHQQMRHLQFMLFEAFSNVLQHAQATEMKVQALVEDGRTVVRVIDNGRGFDPTATSHRGLRALRDRASAIGAMVRVDSRPGQTVLELVLPALPEAATASLQDTSRDTSQNISQETQAAAGTPVVGPSVVQH